MIQPRQFVANGLAAIGRVTFFPIFPVFALLSFRFFLHRIEARDIDARLAPRATRFREFFARTSPARFPVDSPLTVTRDPLLRVDK